ncbi:MAG: hypothetical protein ACE5JX_08555 [Acidobacteriota bacterium]
MLPPRPSGPQFVRLDHSRLLLAAREVSFQQVNRDDLIPALVRFELAKAGRQTTHLPTAQQVGATLGALMGLGQPVERLEPRHLIQVHRVLAGKREAALFRQGGALSICANHDPLSPARVQPALKRFFEWVRGANFGSLHPVQQMTLAQLRLYEISPFQRHSEITASLFPTYFLLAGGHLLPLPEPDELEDFYAALSSAFALDTSELVSLNLKACQRSYARVSQELPLERLDGS